MARYLGPKHKRCRRAGERLCNSEKCPVSKRNYPPGIHGLKGKRSKISEYGLQLQEKQKTKHIYGILEKQFRNYFIKADSKKEPTDLSLGRMLEMRLDNVIFRLGFAETRCQARQLASHAHFLINDKKVNIPSYQVKVGDEITLKSKSRQAKLFAEIDQKLKEHRPPKWLSAVEYGGKVAALPDTEDLKQNINFKQIIEFYSR